MMPKVFDCERNPVARRPVIGASFEGKWESLSPKTRRKHWEFNDTVDGRNPAPPGMYKTLYHQQYMNEK